MRGSSTPPGHSKVVCSSLSGYSTGALRRVKRSPSALSANPIRDVCRPISVPPVASSARYSTYTLPSFTTAAGLKRSEEHTSELQSRLHLVCRLLLEKKKTEKAYDSLYSLIKLDTDAHVP